MRLRKPKLVRVHLKQDKPDIAAPSIEGVLIGRVAGHYRLASPKHLDDSGSTRVVDGEALIPRENVLYLQVIG